MDETVIVDTARTLALVHRGLAAGGELADAAESVLSALVLQLRHPQCTLPGALRSRLDLLTALH